MATLVVSADSHVMEPAGGNRLVMPATGVIHTVVNGVPVYEHGHYTGATPGEVLHS